MGKTAETSTYCRKCFYDLRGIGTPSRCPECGRPFDLADPKTFRTRRPRGIWRRARWVVYPLLLVVLVAGGCIGWVWWEWRQEQPVIAWAQSHPGRSWRPVALRLIGPEWIQRPAGRYTYLLERAVELHACAEPGKTFPSAELPLSRLRYLEKLELKGGGIGDELMGEVGRLRHLRRLGLYNTLVADEGLNRLAACRRLDRLELNGSHHGDRGLSPLLEHPEITELSVCGLFVDDQAVPVLSRLSKLQYLNLAGTRISLDGLAELRKALPNCRIVGP